MVVSGKKNQTATASRAPSFGHVPRLKLSYVKLLLSEAATSSGLKIRIGSREVSAALDLHIYSGMHTAYIKAYVF